MWYVLWSFGAPELLVDYVGSSLRLIPRFFTDYATWWPFIIFPLLGVIIKSILLFVSKLRHCEESKATWQSITKYTLFFLIALLPVIFLPSHKFALELGLPLVGFSLALSTVFVSAPRTINFALITLFVLYNLSMNLLTFTRHYSVSRGGISKKVASFFQENYPIYPEGKQFFFVNDAKDHGNIWGQSKQISQAVSNSDMFKVFYKDDSIKVLYQDIDGKEKQNSDTIPISTVQFLEL